MTEHEGSPADERIIFLHLPKTGGSSLRAAIERRLPETATYVASYDPDPERRYVRYLQGQVESLDHFEGELMDARLDAVQRLATPEASHRRVYMGHFWFGVDELLPGPSRYITMVRDPVDRVLSLHRYRVTRDGLDQSLAEYVRSGRDFEMDNGQTRRLAGRALGGWPEPVAQTTLDAAQEHLASRFAAVGVTERYEESVVVLARALGLSELRYEWLNRSDGRLPRASLTAELAAVIEERNRFDRQLHRFAGQCLDDSLADVDLRRALRRHRRLGQRLKRRIAGR